jgi:predicted secreted protein
MAETKLARLTASEVDALHILRNLCADDQEFWVEIGQQIVKARARAGEQSAQVILLCDPLRKFPHRSSNSA